MAPTPISSFTDALAVPLSSASRGTMVSGRAVPTAGEQRTRHAFEIPEPIAEMFERIGEELGCNEDHQQHRRTLQSE